MNKVHSSRFRRGSRAALLVLALLAAPAAALAQDAGSTVVQDRPLAEKAALSSTPSFAQGGDPAALAAPRLFHDTNARADMTPSLSRHLLIGSGIGAAAGTLFALAVVSIADCNGPNCPEERVVGVAGHALAGAAVGALAGGVTWLVRR